MSANPPYPLFDPGSIPHSLQSSGRAIGSRKYEYRLVLNGPEYWLQWRTVSSLLSFVVWRSAWSRGTRIYVNGNKSAAIGVLREAQETERKRHMPLRPFEVVEGA